MGFKEYSLSKNIRNTIAGQAWASTASIKGRKSENIPECPSFWPGIQNSKKFLLALQLKDSWEHSLSQQSKSSEEKVTDNKPIQNMQTSWIVEI